MYRKIPIMFVKTRTSVQFLGQIDMSAVQNAADAKACTHQVKEAQLLLIKLTLIMALLAMLNNKPQK
jgi:hypothetical protein